MRRALRDLRPIAGLYAGGPRAMLLAGIGLSGLATLAGIGLLGLSGWFITATAVAGASLATALAFDVFAPAAGIRLLALTRTAARYGERLTTHEATLAILAELRERLFRVWARPAAAHALEKRPARLLFRLTADVDALDTLYLRLVVPAGAALLAILAAATLAGLADPWLGLLVGLTLTATAAGTFAAVLSASRRPARLRAHALEVLRARAADLVRGQTELAAAGRLSAQVAGIVAADRRIAGADDRLNRAETFASVATGLVSAALLALVLVAGGTIVANGGAGAALVALALFATISAFEPFAGLRRGASEAARTLLAARRIGPRLAPQAALPGIEAPPSGSAAILDGVSATHPGAFAPALRALSLSIPRGSRLALIGASGAGKSSVLSLLSGDLRPSSGRLAAEPAARLVQRTELFSDTIAGNLRLAAAHATDAELAEALRAAGLAGQRFAGALSTRLGEGGAGLSGGEARRLAVARLLLHPARLWLLDEPTEGLDGATARDVMRCIAESTGDRTLVIATHVRREAAVADLVATMADGRITGLHRKGTREFDAALAALRAD